MVLHLIQLVSSLFHGRYLAVDASPLALKFYKNICCPLVCSKWLAFVRAVICHATRNDGRVAIFTN